MYGREAAKCITFPFKLGPTKVVNYHSDSKTEEAEMYKKQKENQQTD